MNDILLQQATEQDIPALLDVIHSSFAEYEGRLDPPAGAHHETVESLRLKMSQGGGFVAMVNQEIAGCVIFEREPDSLYLGRLAVLAPYRRRGIARALVNSVEQQARALGYRRVRLGVRVGLPDNRALFENLGYRVIGFGTHAGYTEPTYVHLVKDLDDADSN